MQFKLNIQLFSSGRGGSSMEARERMSERQRDNMRREYDRQRERRDDSDRRNEDKKAKERVKKEQARKAKAKADADARAKAKKKFESAKLGDAYKVSDRKKATAKDLERFGKELREKNRERKEKAKLNLPSFKKPNTTLKSGWDDLANQEYGHWYDAPKTVEDWTRELSTPGENGIETKLTNDGVPTMDYVKEMNRSKFVTKESDVSKGSVIGGLLGGLVSPGVAGLGAVLGDKLNPDKLMTSKKVGYSALDEAIKGNEFAQNGIDSLVKNRRDRDDRRGNNIDYSKITKPQEEVVSPVEPPVLGTDNSLFNAIFRNSKRDSHAKGLGDVMSIFGRG